MSPHSGRLCFSLVLKKLHICQLWPLRVPLPKRGLSNPSTFKAQFNCHLFLEASLNATSSSIIKYWLYFSCPTTLKHVSHLLCLFMLACFSHCVVSSLKAGPSHAYDCVPRILQTLNRCVCVCVCVHARVRACTQMCIWCCNWNRSRRKQDNSYFTGQNQEVWIFTNSTVLFSKFRVLGTYPTI